MEPVGEYFKQVREARGLTLEDIAVKTRIHPDFLRALEDGNFAKLPDQVFVKGFVRSYAQSLGLDEEEALRRFVESAGPFYDKQADLERLRRKQAEDERKRQANRKVLAAAVGVALLGLLLLLTREQSAVAPPPVTAPPLSEPPHSESGAGRSSPVPAQSAVPGPATLAPPELPSEPVLGAEGMGAPRSGEASGAAGREPEAGGARDAATSSGPAASSAVRAGVANEPAGMSGPLVLELEAHELSWVVVQVDNDSPQEALLRPGERVRWKAADKLLLTLGNAGGVRVELNGVPQGPFGPSGRVARDILFKR